MTLVAFDFDGTIVDGDAGVHFAKNQLLHGYLDAWKHGLTRGIVETTRVNLNALSLIARGLWVHGRYNWGSYDRHRMVERAYQGFAGVDAQDARQGLARFAREVLPGKLRDGVVEQMREHANRGDHVVVVSTGVRDLIWPLRDELGIDFEVVACRLREEEGALTGTVEGPLNGAEKWTRILAIAKRRGHDIQEAWAYADHEDDKLILEMVGNPVAVHPTRSLERIAKERGWPILYD